MLRGWERVGCGVRGRCSLVGFVMGSVWGGVVDWGGLLWWKMGREDWDGESDWVGLGGMGSKDER